MTTTKTIEIYKSGDVVILRGSPEQHMTVGGFDDKTRLYSLTWIFNGHPFIAHFGEELLQKVEEKNTIDAVGQQVADLMAANQRLVTDFKNMTELATRSSRNYDALMKDAAQALEFARAVYPEVDAASITEMVRGLANRYETIKREANETITQLQQGNPTA